MIFIDTAFASEVAAQSAQSRGILGSVASLGINYKMFLFQLFNFGVVMLTVWFLILKPLSKKLVERQDIIDQGLENSKKAQANLERSEKDFQKRIQDAKEEAKQIIARAGAQAEKDAEAMKKKTRSEIEAVLRQAKEKIKEEKNSMIADFRTEAAKMVGLALEKFLAVKMDSEKDKEFIERIIQK